MPPSLRIARATGVVPTDQVPVPAIAEECWPRGSVDRLHTFRGMPGATRATRSYSAPGSRRTVRECVPARRSNHGRRPAAQGSDRKGLLARGHWSVPAPRCALNVALDTFGLVMTNLRLRRAGRRRRALHRHARHRCAGRDQHGHAAARSVPLCSPSRNVRSRWSTAICRTAGQRWFTPVPQRPGEPALRQGPAERGTGPWRAFPAAQPSQIACRGGI